MELLKALDSNWWAIAFVLAVVIPSPRKALPLRECFSLFVADSGATLIDIERIRSICTQYTIRIRVLSSRTYSFGVKFLSSKGGSQNDHRRKTEGHKNR